MTTPNASEDRFRIELQRLVRAAIRESPSALSLEKTIEIVSQAGKLAGVSDLDPASLNDAMEQLRHLLPDVKRIFDATVADIPGGPQDPAFREAFISRFRERVSDWFSHLPEEDRGGPHSA